MNFDKLILLKFEVTILKVLTKKESSEIKHEILVFAEISVTESPVLT